MAVDGQWTASQVDWTAAKEIFLDLLEVDAPQREQLAAERCGADQRLRLAVDRLLKAHHADDSFFVEPKPTASTGSPVLEDKPLERLGVYHIREVLGEGGFGIVYRAEQRTPVAREVAVKVIKPGLNASAVLRRFASERDALARLEHPGIARVLDAGTADDGRPFVVMELVRGESITRTCVERNLAVHDRVALMARVCRAIHHAHQRAIIHRDIKPSNILVTEIDGVLQPRVIDFGIAVALTESQNEKAAVASEMIGTPRYMSPEQLADPNAFDVRIDVYSLGVVLCEVLTGLVPRNPKSVAGSKQEVAAERPSRLVLQEKTGQPKSDIAVESRWLRGDLDRIILKCVSWMPDDRYESAAAMADDLERYLRGEPVAAAGAGAMYRTRKFIARHKIATSLTALAALSLMVGIALAVVGQRRADAARRIAEDAREAASQQAARAEFVSQFLLEDMLIASDPDAAVALQQPLSIEQLFASAKGHVWTRMNHDPQSMFEILGRIGSGYLMLRQAESAVDVLRKAIDIGEQLGPTASADVLRLRITLAEAMQKLDGNTPAITAMIQRLRTQAIAEFGPDHPVSQRARFAAIGPAMEAQQQVEELNALLALDAHDLHFRYEMLRRKGSVLRSMKRFDDDVQTRRENVRLADQLFDANHSSRMSAQFQLITALASAGQHAEALTLAEALVAIAEDVVPPTHPGRMSAFSLVVRLSLELGKNDRAMAMALNAERFTRRHFTAGSPEHVLTAQLLGRSLIGSGFKFEGEPLLALALNVAQTPPDAPSPKTAELLALLSHTMQTLGQEEAAQELADEAAKRSR